MSAPDTIVTIVRHGRTFANTDGIWHGSTDTPLDPVGHRQAARVGLHLARTQPDLVAVYHEIDGLERVERPEPRPPREQPRSEPALAAALLSERSPFRIERERRGAVHLSWSDALDRIAREV